MVRFRDRNYTLDGGWVGVGIVGAGAATTTGRLLATELATSTGPATGTASEVALEVVACGSSGSIIELIVGLTLKLISPGCFGVAFNAVSIFFPTTRTPQPTLEALGAAFGRLFFPGDPALSGISLSIGIPGLGA